MTDLSSLVPKNKTVDIIVKHPATGEVLQNDDGTDMTITLHAPYTKEYRSAGFNKANERLKSRKGSKEFDFTFEELEEAGVDLLAEVTLGWNITFDGEQPKFTKKKAKEIYAEVFWLKNQIEGAINDSVDFTKV